MADDQREILRYVYRAFNLQTCTALRDVPHQTIDGRCAVGQNRPGFQRALSQASAMLLGAGGTRTGAVTGRTGRGRAVCPYDIVAVFQGRLSDRSRWSQLRRKYSSILIEPVKDCAGKT